MSGFKSYSKIVLRGINFRGGAPRSAYQYMKILNQDGCKVTVIMQEGDKCLQDLYKSTFHKVNLSEYFGHLWEQHRIFKMFYQLMCEYRWLKKNKPDIVFSLGHLNGYFYGPMCNSLNIPSVMIIAGGDLSSGGYLLKGCLCDHVICFSEENKEVLIKYIDADRITVISNRIEIKTTFQNLSGHYTFSQDAPIRVLLTSRVHTDKYESIVAFIELLNNAANTNRKIELAIAGGGNCLDKLKAFAASLTNPYLTVDIKGHVDNLLPEFEKAHIVVGKGRSVIEPIMMNRLGCVIGDDGKIEVCTSGNFERLYRYNFSGRGLEEDAPQQVLNELLVSLTDGSINCSQIEETAQLVKQYYSSEFLADKFHSVLNTMKPMPDKVKRLSIGGLVLKLILRKIQRKLNKKF